jgi:ABC-type dipeptide/oligopeptide/nickel transport system permease subunit
MNVLRQLRDRKAAWFGLAMLAIILLSAIFAPQIAPHDPLAVDLLQKLQPPSAQFPLGTDHLGRCLLSRLVYGGQISLLIALIVISCTTLISLVVGLLAGYLGGMSIRCSCDYVMFF